MKLLSLYLLIYLGSGLILTNQAYNQISHRQFPSFQNFSSVFVDASQRLNQNVIVGLAEDSCWEQLLSFPFFQAVEHFAAGSSLQSVSVPRSGFPQFNGDSADCILILSYKRGDLITAPSAVTSNLNPVEFSEWMVERTRTTLTFTNTFPFSVDIYYHAESSEPTFQLTLPSEQSMSLTSFLGHIFSVSVASGEENAEFRQLSPLNEINHRPEYQHAGFQYIVDFFVVKDEFYEISVHNRLETCEVITQQTLNELSFALPNDRDESKDEHGVCNNVLLRFIEFSHRIWYEKRLGSNYVQPKVVRPVTSSGFELRRLPHDTYRWLLQWYQEEQQKQEQSETVVGPCMNQHLAPSSITHLDPANKRRFENEMRPLLEQWYGGSLYLTSIYGIRKYINGSILRMHVDTIRTHVVSAIINVDQEVEKDWPLVILDHEDNEHSIVMKPGDMLFYESAKLIHGRPEPFIGSHYDNIFIHFRPTNKEEWDYDWFV